MQDLTELMYVSYVITASSWNCYNYIYIKKELYIYAVDIFLSVKTNLSVNVQNTWNSDTHFSIYSVSDTYALRQHWLNITTWTSGS